MQNVLFEDFLIFVLPSLKYFPRLTSLTLSTNNLCTLGQFMCMEKRLPQSVSVLTITRNPIESSLRILRLVVAVKFPVRRALQPPHSPLGMHPPAH